MHTIKSPPNTRPITPPTDMASITNNIYNNNIIANIAKNIIIISSCFFISIKGGVRLARQKEKPKLNLFFETIS